jgi:hypothetical protein
MFVLFVEDEHLIVRGATSVRLAIDIHKTLVNKKTADDATEKEASLTQFGYSQILSAITLCPGNGGSSGTSY